MARITGFLDGKISGKLGNFVYYGKNGKTFLRTIGIRKTDPSSSEIARRKKFAMSIKLAKSINSVPELKSLWDAYKSSKGSACNAIQKANYVRVNGDDIYIAAAIIPDALSFCEPAETVTISGNMLRFKLNNDETSGIYNNNLRDKAVIAGVIFMKDVIYSDIVPFRFTGVKGTLEKEGKNDYAVINIEDFTLRAMEAYDSFTLYFGLVCGDIGFGNFSRTISKG
ncbi:MAG: hypothetical protein WC139_12810 [Candidatus Kapaibacterium sp.]